MIFSRPWPALTHHRPAVPSSTRRPSCAMKCMSFAPTSKRGACLNCLLAENGIQNAERSMLSSVSMVPMIAPVLPAGLVEEFAQRPVERVRLLQVGQMRRGGNDHQFRTGQGMMYFLGHRHRRAGIVLADDNQAGAADFLQPRGQIDFRDRMAAADVARHERG